MLAKAFSRRVTMFATVLVALVVSAPAYGTSPIRNIGSTDPYRADDASIGMAQLTPGDMVFFAHDVSRPGSRPQAAAARWRGRR